MPSQRYRNKARGVLARLKSMAQPRAGVWAANRDNSEAVSLKPESKCRESRSIQEIKQWARTGIEL
jgi:hypothetical protein